MNIFERTIASGPCGGLCGTDLGTLQVNLGLMCNQQCSHCHLACSPRRTEIMEWPVMERTLAVADAIGPDVVDLTGGAPEMNPNFRRFVEALRNAGRQVQVRTNLTVLGEKGMETMGQFLWDHSVRLVASMPCYRAENVDAQRGEHVHERSIESLRRLNAIGFGREGGLELTLVYNPVGPTLPPDASALEADYRRELGERFGVAFTRLITITNMPIGRFADRLHRQGAERKYMRLLRNSYNPATVDGLMCRHQVEIAWDGTLYDCDFNLALKLPVDHGAPAHIADFDPAALVGRRIVTGKHCFGCTAGAGSSCSGRLA